MYNMAKEILNWTSKVQIKKGTPYISLVKHLKNNSRLLKGSVVECKLVMDKGKLRVEIGLD